MSRAVAEAEANDEEARSKDRKLKRNRDRLVFDSSSFQFLVSTLSFISI